MENIIHYIDLNVNEGLNPKRTLFKQNTNLYNRLIIHLFDQNGQISLPTDYYYYIYTLKPDGKYCIYGGQGGQADIMTVADDTITIIPTKQMIVASGTEKCEILISTEALAEITDDTETLYTATFLIYLEANVITDETIESQNDFSSVKVAIDKANLFLAEYDELMTDISNVKKELGEGVDATSSSLSDIAESLIEAANEVTERDDPDITNGIKSLINGYEGAKIIIDDEMSTTSTNAVQNKVITKAFNDEAEIIGTHKNLLVSTLQTQTYHGITCTRNSDGTYTLNGTATGFAPFRLMPQTLTLNGTYRLTGCPTTGVSGSCYLTATLGGFDISYTHDTGSGSTYNYSSKYGFCIYVNEGAVLTNAVFKPMLSSDTSLTYDDYTPPTGTNATLMADVSTINFDLLTAVGYDIGLSIDESTYVMTLQLKNKSGDVISTKTIDLPLESMVVGASYKNGVLTLTLKNGETIDVPISDLVSGLVKTSDIVDNLTSTDTNKPLSANMGKTLKDTFDNSVVVGTKAEIEAKISAGTIAEGTKVVITDDGNEYVIHQMSIDDALSSTSENGVQNKVITSAINAKQDKLTAGSNISISGNTISATNTTYPDATTSAHGLMSASDKSKLDGIATGAEVNVQSDWNVTDASSDAYIKNKPTIPSGVTVDTELSTTSTNPVQNKVLTTALGNRQPANTAVKYGGTAIVGSATNPVWVDKTGTVNACTYSLEKSVPSNAVFTDTTYDMATTTSPGLMSATDKVWVNSVSSKQNSNTAVKRPVDKGVGSATNPVYVASDGTATTTTYTLEKSVPSDAVFTDTNTTYKLSKSDSGSNHNIILTPSSGNADTITFSDATTTSAGFMSANDKTKLDSISGYIKTISSISDLSVSAPMYWVEGMSIGDVLCVTQDIALSDVTLPAGKYKLLKYGTTDSKAIVAYSSHEYLTDTSANYWAAESSGTVTSVSVKMNGASKGTVTTSGTIDLGDVATLGTDGKIPSSQLPSYVDDVLEYDTKSAFPTTGESGKIYIDISTKKTYRWSGSEYVEISSSIVIGTTTGTALDGKTGTDHINSTSNPHSVTKSQVGLGNVENKSSATIRGELTSSNVTTALGYTPYNSTNPNGYTTNTGTVTSVAIKMNDTTKGTITSSGTIDLGTVVTDVSTKQDALTAVKYGGKAAIGSTTTPVYVDVNGNANACSYSLNKTVPSDAKFTDTTYSNATTTDAGLMSASDKVKLDSFSGFVKTISSSSDVSYQSSMCYVTNMSVGDILNVTTNIQTTYATIPAGRYRLVSLFSGYAAVSYASTLLLTNSTYWSAMDSYQDATQTTHGLMSTTDKIKLDGIATGATANTGTVTSITIKMNGSDVKTITTSGTVDLGTVITAHQDISGKVNVTDIVDNLTSSATNKPLSANQGYVLSDKIADLDDCLHDCVTGKLVGGETNPIYIDSDGAAQDCLYSLNTTVPANAKFTDTTYSAGDNISISGTTISGNYSNATTTTAGLMSASDKAALDYLASIIFRTISSTSDIKMLTSSGFLYYVEGMSIGQILNVTTDITVGYHVTIPSGIYQLVKFVTIDNVEYAGLCMVTGELLTDTTYWNKLS